MFAIRVPFVDAAGHSDPVPTHRYRYEPTNITLLHGIFAIVVDDERDARHAMQRLLERWGCLVLGAAGADEALSMLAQHDRVPELVICDYHLAAGDNGVVAIRRIQALFECVVPAILVTANASPDVLRAGKVHHIPILRKPVAPAKLRALLHELLTHARRDHGEGATRGPPATFHHS